MGGTFLNSIEVIRFRNVRANLFSFSFSVPLSCSLEQNWVGPEAGKALAKALEKNDTLEILKYVAFLFHFQNSRSTFAILGDPLMECLC